MSEEYEVEEITGVKYEFETNQLYFLVKWIGHEEETWEIESNLTNCRYLAREWLRHGKRLSKYTLIIIIVFFI